MDKIVGYLAEAIDPEHERPLLDMMGHKMVNTTLRFYQQRNWLTTLKRDCSPRPNREQDSR